VEADFVVAIDGAIGY